MIKKLSITLLSLFLLSGCASQSSQLELSPVMPTSQQVNALINIPVAVTSVDARQSKALAELNRNAKLLTLTASRLPEYLMQEVVEQQMRNRGYTIKANSGTTLQVSINELFANVQEGNLHHQIDTTVDISLVAKAANGSSYTKNYKTTYSTQGALAANNNGINAALNQTLTEVIGVMAKDTAIDDFIRRNAQ